MTASAHVTVTFNLTVDDYTAVFDRAALWGATVAEHINRLIAESLIRPEWADISEANAVAAHITALEGERDRARETAARLEEEDNRLREILLEEFRRGGIIASGGVLKKLGYDVTRSPEGHIQWAESAQ